MLDRGKAERARALSSSSSISDAVEVALDRLIAEEELRRDVIAYLGSPPTADELALLRVPPHFDLADADVDYDTIYGTRG